MLPLKSLRGKTMTISSAIPGPECSKCEQPMLWQSVQLVGARPMNVFQCETCDKLAAVAATDASMAGESDRNNTALA